MANDPVASDTERDKAERAMAAWLKRHGKTGRDIQAILVKADEDDKKAKPPPSPSDPRDSAPDPFDDPAFTPAGLVEGIIGKYVAAPRHVLTILALWVCFTHVYLQFRIAPRVVLVSDDPESGKTTTLEVVRRLVYRPNPESLGTGAAIAEFLDAGPGTVLLDELDQIDREARRRLQQLWNLGHLRGASVSLQVAGKRKLISLHAPMLAAGVGSFLAPTQRSRTFVLEMAPYDAATKPEREFDDADTADLDKVYRFLRHRAAKMKLNPKPEMPPGMQRRFADNVRGALAIADACGPEWGRRAREAMVWLHEREKAERPEVRILHHILVIIDTLELDPIPSRVVNRELRRLDLPEARWNRYRGAGGGEYAHPLTHDEQAALLRKSGIAAKPLRPPGGGKQFRGYRREWFEAALRERGTAEVPRLRLITPASD
jgi:Protein of unknown function (DUF3631)